MGRIFWLKGQEYLYGRGALTPPPIPL